MAAASGQSRPWLGDRVLGQQTNSDGIVYWVADGTVWGDGTPTVNNYCDWAYLHQGGRYDEVSGLYGFRHRDYSPTLQRWLQQDPMGTTNMLPRGIVSIQLDLEATYIASNRIFSIFGLLTVDSHLWQYADGANLYRLTGSNPILANDPSGLQPNDKLYGLPGRFWDWYHREVKKNQKLPDLTKEEAYEHYNDWKNEGMPDAEGKRQQPKPPTWFMPNGLLIFMIFPSTILEEMMNPGKTLQECPQRRGFTQNA